MAIIIVSKWFNELELNINLTMRNLQILQVIVYETMILIIQYISF